jgi:predicted nucleic acid-binding Zn ribbon protein
MTSATPKTIGSAIARLFESLGLGARLKQYEVLDKWGEIVGEKIASVTNAERIESGRLFVHVTRSTWRNELVFLKAGIIAKINTQMNAEVVKDIIFR